MKLYDCTVYIYLKNMTTKSLRVRLNIIEYFRTDWKFKLIKKSNRKTPDMEMI